MTLSGTCRYGHLFSRASGVLFTTSLITSTFPPDTYKTLRCKRVRCYSERLGEKKFHVARRALRPAIGQGKLCSREKTSTRCMSMCRATGAVDSRCDRCESVCRVCTVQSLGCHAQRRPSSVTVSTDNRSDCRALYLGHAFGPPRPTVRIQLTGNNSAATRLLCISTRLTRYTHRHDAARDGNVQ